MIPINSQDENLNQISTERCQQCDAVFLIKDINPNYDGVVSTYSNDRYCSFFCITNSGQK